MRLAILLGLILSWVSGVGGQALAHSDRSVNSALFSVSAQATVTPAATTGIGPAPLSTATATQAITATIEATSSLTETATVTVTNTPGPPPPTIAIAQATPQPQVPLQLNPFHTGFLFGTPSPPMGPFAWACFALMLGLLGVSGYFYAVKRPQWKRTNTVLYKAANKWAQPGLWLAITGLLLVLFRIVGLDFFNLRFWLYLWLLAVVGMGAWFFYWYRTSYPRELEKFRKTQKAKQYMPGASAKTLARQPDRTTLKPAQSARPAQKGTRPPGSTPTTNKAPGDKKRRKDR